MQEVIASNPSKITPMNFLKLAPLALCAPLSAVPIALDSFPINGSDYTSGPGNLVGQSAVVDGFTGLWLEAFDGAESPGVLATGLSYPGAPSNGGAVAYPGGGNGRAGRLLETSYDDASDGVPVYLSVLMELDSVGDGYRAFELHTGGFDDGGNRRLQIATVH